MAKGKPVAAYTGLNPAKIEKMTLKEIRKAYTTMRDVMRKRNQRLEAAGKPINFPTPPKLKDMPDSVVKQETAELARALKDPRSMLKTIDTKEARISSTLESHGYEIPPDQLDDFGRFMEETRKRMGETYVGKSGGAARAYTELRKAGVSGKTLARSFKKYMENMDRLSDLVTAAQNARKSHPDKRVTGVELEKIMKEAFPL